jgi:hypothetical protein
MLDSPTIAKAWIVVLLAFVSLSLSGTESQNTLPSHYEFFTTAGKTGLRTPEGAVIIPAIYDALGWSNRAQEPFKGLLGYQLGELWGLITLENKRITSPEYIQLYPGSARLLVAAKIGKFSGTSLYGMINTDGKITVPFKYEHLKPLGMRALVILRSGREYPMGLIDHADKVIIPAQYRQITPLGELRYAVENFAGKISIFDDLGKQLIGFELDSIGSFHGGYAKIVTGHRVGAINLRGEVLVPAAYRDVRKSGDHPWEVMKFPEWAVLKADNTSMHTYTYDRLTPIDATHFKVQANDREWIMREDETPLTSPQNSHLGEFHGGVAPYIRNGKQGAVNAYGREILPPAFDSVYVGIPFIWAKEKMGTETGWSLFDTLGVKKTVFLYEEINPWDGRLFPIRRKGYWGWMDRSGKEVIPCVYEDFKPYFNHLAVVKWRGLWGIINREGDWVVQPQKNALRVLSEKHYLESNGRLRYLRAFTGELVYFTENEIEIRDTYLIEKLPSGALWRIDYRGRITSRSGPDVHPKYQELHEPSEGFFGIKLDGKYGFVDHNDKLRIANRYEGIGAFKNGLAAVKIRGAWGFVDKLENLVIQPWYQNVGDFTTGYATASRHGHMGIIDMEGRVVIPFEFDDIIHLSHGNYLIFKDNQYGLANKDGRIIITPRYESLLDLNNGFAIVKRRGKMGLITLEGVSTIPMMFDELIYNPYNDTYLGKTGAEWQKKP